MTNITLCQFTWQQFVFYCIHVAPKDRNTYSKVGYLTVTTFHFSG